jgi:hypothetical protein
MGGCKSVTHSAERPDIGLGIFASETEGADDVKTGQKTRFRLNRVRLGLAEPFATVERFASRK